MAKYKCLALAGVVAILAPLGADAQTVDPSQEIVGWVCSNQSTVSWVLGLLLAHLGLSLTSATLKKLGATDGPWVQIIRLLAVDLKPPPQAIVAEADQLKAQGKA